ncbi:sulfate/molybdate ABC transporter ATP-binding protein [Paracoccus sp. MC1854]|uniref:sulfate/molybdate ABC transporter ATP-binding protein n=1 Tax=Paracoccus sp. MC1854 TaxID=2760306 RepID=UPI0015FF93B0|nr:sulfate/molybdate ABC transporter ATP-binding protein [Paracoccus sp. MC1854]MBB1491487.1 sulfate/molybdate ABC transporter ATP-binding protein [Paracoccus sp. MC1854]
MTIEIAQMTKSFGRTEVLRGIDLTVADGELVALLGPSGSGKTTLLKIIAGLEWPDAGRLAVDGADWLKLDPQDRRIGFVFQNYALFPHMTVRDNIAFGLTVRPRGERPSRAEISRRVDELLGFLQIEALGDRHPAQLSGGQRQRVALGRALAIEPTVLLLDEPFGALDAAVRRDLRQWLRSVHDATGTTTIFVTHDQEEAFELADRVVVLDGGRIVQSGDAAAIHDAPASPFVANFMGATIELPVAVRGGRVAAEGIETDHLPSALPDGPARLFMRPEDLTPIPDPDGPWTIASVTNTGAHLRLVLADAAGTKIPADLRRRSPRAAQIAPGVRVHLRPEHASVFPAETA